MVAKNSRLSHDASPAGQCDEAFQANHAVWNLRNSLVRKFGSVKTGLHSRRFT
jgi:hypothetical protein